MTVITNLATSEFKREDQSGPAPTRWPVQWTLPFDFVGDVEAGEVTGEFVGLAVAGFGGLNLP